MKSILISGVLALATTTSLFAKADPALIDVKKLAPGIIVEMRYATTNNFTKKKLYPVADECLLCEPAAQRLARVQKTLEKQGLGLKIWDCYRPVSVQWKLWEVVPDPNYVADPKLGSRHNRGASVDLTLVDAKGNELQMPTEFDEFTEKAHRDYMDLPANARKNRTLLENAMKAEGFLPLPSEWWHFDAPEWSSYALRDEPLGSASLYQDKAAEPISIPTTTTQLVIVVSKDWNATTATLQRYERRGSEWIEIGQEWPVSLGLKGMAWGRGEKAMGGAGPVKKEGDNAAPAGIFKIGKAYGYANHAPDGSAWPYQQVIENWRCVDDPSSSRYNEIFPMTPSTKKDWSSAEQLRRADHLYKWFINVEQNTPAKRGCGSCIFLHVWRKPGSGTEGCTAMDEQKIVELMRWLKPDANPLLIQLPATEYDQFRKNSQIP